MHEPLFRAKYFSLQQKTCNFSSKYVGAMMSGIIAINTGSESDLQAALTYAGPVAAAVDAKSTGFRVRTLSS